MLPNYTLFASPQNIRMYSYMAPPLASGPEIQYSQPQFKLREFLRPRAVHWVRWMCMNSFDYELYFP